MPSSPARRRRHPESERGRREGFLRSAPARGGERDSGWKPRLDGSRPGVRRPDAGGACARWSMLLDGATRWRGITSSRARAYETERYEASVADHSDEAHQTRQAVDSGAAEAVAEDERYRGATPPGYDWPTHGGYLGCLLGVMAACLVAPLGYILFGFLGAFLARPLGGFGVALAIIVTVGAYLALFVALTRLGWFMGKRFLREYEQPARPVWGEDDEEPDEYGQVVEADAPCATGDATLETTANAGTEADTGAVAYAERPDQATQGENVG